MLGGIEYIFGTGDGLVTHWSTPADLDLDGDGVLDAVVLDFDGDGLIDDALWDSDGDGAADIMVLNFWTVDFGEGGDLPGRSQGPSAAGVVQGSTAAQGYTAAQWYTDPDGDGTWSGYRQGGPDQAAPVDSVDVVTPACPTEPGPEPRPTPPVVVAEPAPAVLVDSDGDGVLDTGLTDTDGDGLLDTASAATVRLRAGDWWEWGVTQR